MGGGNLIRYKTCACCGEQISITDTAHWEWKMHTNQKRAYDYFCTYKCYSKVFDSKFKASRVSSRVSKPSSMPIELERAIRGYRGR